MAHDNALIKGLLVETKPIVNTNEPPRGLTRTRSSQYLKDMADAEAEDEED
jgi:hypothetical protein